MTKHMSMKSVLAGSALLGTLALGAIGGAGVAGATTAPPSTPAHSINCARAEARVPKIEARESKAPALLSKAQAHEAKATSGGHPKAATFIAHRIKRIERLQARGERILKRIQAACGGSGTSSTSTSGSTSVN
jgi:hypothetical protein